MTEEIAQLLKTLRLGRIAEILDDVIDAVDRPLRVYRRDVEAWGLGRSRHGRALARRTTQTTPTVRPNNGLRRSGRSDSITR